MIGMLVLLAVLSPQVINSPANAPSAQAGPAAVRVEKLTPAEMRQLTAARKEVADAEAKLAAAKRDLQGTTEGIEQAHNANTDCGCYEQTEGRDYDKVEFQGDSIIIHHIYEPPTSLR
jgi:hypothetical protein